MEGVEVTQNAPVSRDEGDGDDVGKGDDDNSGNDGVEGDSFAYL